MTLPRALLLVLALLQAVGVADYMRRVACAEDCRQDGCNDQAPCDAPSCACHSPAGPTMTAPAVVRVASPVQRPATAVVFATDDLRASPDPREILHVPRLVAV